MAAAYYSLRKAAGSRTIMTEDSSVEPIRVTSLEDVLKVKMKGVLAKRVSGNTIDWQNRYVTLDDEKIYIRQDEHGENRHAINLLSITHVKKVLIQEPNKALKRTRSVTTEKPATPEPEASQIANTRIGMNSLQWENAFEIYLERQGITYYFRAGSSSECHEWVSAINDAMKEAEEAYIQSLRISAAERTRLAVRRMYEHNITQGLVSALLLANFATSIIQGELGARDAQQLLESLDLVDMVFTFVYSVELVICMYCTPWREFFTSGWCW
jgi:hypothetical protein